MQWLLPTYLCPNILQLWRMQFLPPHTLYQITSSGNTRVTQTTYLSSISLLFAIISNATVVKCIAMDWPIGVYSAHSALIWNAPAYVALSSIKLTRTPWRFKVKRVITSLMRVAIIFLISNLDAKLVDSLHYQRATLPSKVSHAWDRHPLYLIYSFPLIDDPEDVFCEVCEENIQPKVWLYHCRVCAQSFHPQCVLAIDRHSNVKFGGTLQIKRHLHAVTFVRKSMNKFPPPCDRCGKHKEDVPILECAPCNFQLCVACVPNIS